MSEGKLLTIQDVADVLRVSKRKVYRLIQGGELRAVAIPHGRYKVANSDLQTFLKGLKQGKDSSGGEAEEDGPNETESGTEVSGEGEEEGAEAEEEEEEEAGLDSIVAETKLIKARTGLLEAKIQEGQATGQFTILEQVADEKAEIERQRTELEQGKAEFAKQKDYYHNLEAEVEQWRAQREAMETAKRELGAETRRLEALKASLAERGRELDGREVAIKAREDAIGDRERRCHLAEVLGEGEFGA